MRSTVLTLGSKEYTVNELASRKAAAWRQIMQDKLGNVAEMIASAPETDITSGSAISGLVRSIGSTVIGSTDTIIELLFLYSPELSSDRERINDECYDSELIAAFVEVVKLAYPFGQLANLVARLGSGVATR